MDQHHANVQRAQYRYVHQDIAKAFVRNDCPVNADHKGAFPELWNILQNAAQVGELHVMSEMINSTRQ